LCIRTRSEPNSRSDTHYGRKSCVFPVVLLFCSLAATFSAPAQSQAPTQDWNTYNGCGLEGDARSPAVRALNRLKNRVTAPAPDDINPKVTLAAMLVPGNDIGRWKVRYGVQITGYVEDVKVGGVETVNCHARDPQYRDTHIELVLDPMHSGEVQRVIVEVTPRWRAMMAAKGVDWSTRGLRDRFLGRWIKVTGWMLFDVEHKSEAENTAPGRVRNWRATAWEVHPVTAIEVVSRPSAE
jgi:hypothetical protein